MRVSCNLFDDWMQNLVSVERVFGGTVYFSVTRQPQDGQDRRKALVFSVVVQASAVIELSEDSQYLLECGEDVGTDNLCADGHTDGSDRAKVYRDRLVEFAEPRGIKVMPGIISE